jgi:putative permease
VQYLMWLILIVYLSIIVATVLDVPVGWVMRLKVRRGIAAVIVMLVSLGVVVGLLVLMANAIYGQVQAISSNLGNAPERINSFVNHLRQRFPALDRMDNFDVSAEVAKGAPSATTMLQHALGGVEAISWVVIMFFLVLYMLIDGPDHLKVMRSLLPKRSRLEATQLFRDIAKAHRGWALASMANVASATTLIGTGLFVVGIPGAYLLGFIAGLGELIPNIGPILGALPALLFTLVAQPEKFFWVLGMFLVLQTIQSWTISPQMLKFSVELPVLVTILSVLVFGILFGVLGVLVAIPLVTDMVVVWHLISRHIEHDPTEYDVVKTAPEPVRAPMSPDNTPPSRLRKLFRSYRAEAEEARKAAAIANGPPKGEGMAKLEQAERKSRGGESQT